jgi:hypothetical protein
MSGRQLTPLEVFEYKRRWRPDAFQVDVHSDLEDKCRVWCKQNLKRWEWECSTFTDMYSHSYLFETESHAREFAMEFEEWVDKGKG